MTRSYTITMAHHHKHDIKHILEELNQYMFTRANIQDTVFSENTKSNVCNDISSMCSSIKKDTTQKDFTKKNFTNTHFVPDQTDKLFWCYYIMKYGMDNYTCIDKKHFSLEKKIKIEIAESLKSHENLLKQNSLKIPEVENELVNEQKISILGLHALCVLDHINALYVFDKKYYDIQGISESTRHLIEKNEQGEFGIVHNVEEARIHNIVNSYYQIKSYKKPILAISAYKVDELKNIAQLFNISLTNNQGIKKTKKIIYQDILNKM